MYDLETFIKIRAVSNRSCIYKLSRNSGKYYRDLSENYYQKRLNNCVVFKRAICINEIINHISSFKREPNKIKNKIVE